MWGIIGNNYLKIDNIYNFFFIRLLYINTQLLVAKYVGVKAGYKITINKSAEKEISWDQNSIQYPNKASTVNLIFIKINIKIS